MCDLKSFDDVATLSQGQKHEVARLVEALCQRYDAARSFSVRIQVTVTSAHNFAAIGPPTEFVMHRYENRYIFAHSRPG
jgi:hypothetical protein